jgi:hypothetical protein
VCTHLNGYEKLLPRAHSGRGVNLNIHFNLVLCLKLSCVISRLSKRKANWIGHILPRNCLLRQVIEGKIKRWDRSDWKTRKKTQEATG